MENKLEAQTKESEYYKRKCEEVQSQMEELREKERLMSIKYGVLINHN